MLDSFLGYRISMSPENSNRRNCFHVKLMAEGKKGKVPKSTRYISGLVQRLQGYFQVTFLLKKSNRESSLLSKFSFLYKETWLEIIPAGFKLLQHATSRWGRKRTVRFWNSATHTHPWFTYNLCERWMLWIPLLFSSLPATNLSEAVGLL